MATQDGGAEQFGPSGLLLGSGWRTTRTRHQSQTPSWATWESRWRRCLRGVQPGLASRHQVTHGLGMTDRAYPAIFSGVS